MICGASAPDSGLAPLPEKAMQPVETFPQTANANNIESTPGPCPKRYCSLHSARESRIKGEPKLEECKSCRQQIQTNCAEFSVCPACSELQHACMICGASTDTDVLNVEK